MQIFVGPAGNVKAPVALMPSISKKFPGDADRQWSTKPCAVDAGFATWLALPAPLQYPTSEMSRLKECWGMNIEY
jgi:hypothetical protein